MSQLNLISHFFISTILVLFTSLILFQDQVNAQDERIPALPAFESGYLINGQSVTMRSARSLEFAIQHRFGQIDSGARELFGLYAHARDIRIGINYSLTDRIQIGYGTAKGQFNHDLNYKLLLLRQSRDDVIPISVAYAGNAAVSARDDSNFYPEFSNRLSYYQELMAARRFTHWFSLQISGSYAHFNRLETGLTHDNFSVAARSRFSITPSISVLLDFDHPLSSHEEFSPKTSLGSGFEYATRGHEFQVFVTNFESLTPQRNIHLNTNEITEFDFLIGFNIIRRWNL